MYCVFFCALAVISVILLVMSNMDLHPKQTQSTTSSPPDVGLSMNIDLEATNTYGQAVKRPRNRLDVVAYRGFVITVMNQAFHVVAGGNLVQFLNVYVERSTQLVDVDAMLGKKGRRTPIIEQIVQ